MHGFLRFCIVAAAFGLSAVAYAGEVVTYEVLPGSLLRDECLFCDRIPIVRPIHGTFALEAEEPVVGSVNFKVNDIDFTDDQGDYAVTGKGVYHYLVLAAAEQEAELDIAVNGTALAHLVSGMVPMVRPWPVIQITVKDQTPQDENHVYTLEIIAAPQPPEWKTYRLQKGSELVDDNFMGDGPTVIAPLTGTFLLGEIPGGAGLFYDYVVGKIDFQSAGVDPAYKVGGGGFYRQGGEVALTQFMQLVVTVNDTTGIPLDSGTVGVPAGFPALDITLAHVKPTDPQHVYSLRIVAEPGAPLDPQFRRGDSNSDTVINIADAVFVLGYLFARGTAPTCLDSADTNDDGGIDISDAVRILTHLFAHSGPLPDPFAQCGPDPTRDQVGCERFAPCE